MEGHKVSFSSIEREKAREVIKDLPHIRAWVDTFLEPREFEIKLEGRQDDDE